MSADTRRAPVAYALTDAAGAAGPEGRGEAVIGDDVLSVGPVTVAFVDADALRAADYRVELDLWPGGRLVLTELGRRFDTFVAELRRARDAARVKGLLAHGVKMPEVFTGALLDRTARPADAQVYDTHLTLVPRDGDPFQLPLGSLLGVAAQDEPPGVVLHGTHGRLVVGQLARHRDAFLRAVTGRRDAQARLLHELTGLSCFTDGVAVERPRVPGFEALWRRFASPERVPCGEQLIGLAKGGEPRLGFAQLLDMDEGLPAGQVALPENWACYLLVPVGAEVAFEMLAGPSAATYVFEAGIEQVGSDLQVLHLRRAPLALSGADAEISPVNPYRLALRKLEPLRRLRAATRARVIHNEGWAASATQVLG